MALELVVVLPHHLRGSHWPPYWVPVRFSLFQTVIWSFRPGQSPAPSYIWGFKEDLWSLEVWNSGAQGATLMAHQRDIPTIVCPLPERLFLLLNNVWALTLTFFLSFSKFFSTLILRAIVVYFLQQALTSHHKESFTLSIFCFPPCKNPRG